MGKQSIHSLSPQGWSPRTFTTEANVCMPMCMPAYVHVCLGMHSFEHTCMWMLTYKPGEWQQSNTQKDQIVAISRVPSAVCHPRSAKALH